jgi:membrane fusion protein, multidrug efflux system
VQRLPVRVALDPDELKEHPLRLGLSMHATVDLSDRSGLLVPTTALGSPSYQTPIFEQEQCGDQSAIDAIIAENIDPNLFLYADTPIVASCEPLSPDLSEKIEELLLCEQAVP